MFYDKTRMQINHKHRYLTEMFHVTLEATFFKASMPKSVGSKTQLSVRS